MGLLVGIDGEEKDDLIENGEGTLEDFQVTVGNRIEGSGVNADGLAHTLFIIGQKPERCPSVGIETGRRGR